MTDHIPGSPQYSVGDIVEFEMTHDGETRSLYGSIEIVDKYGAWEIDNPREPSYDIIVDDWFGNGRALVKHVRESVIRQKL